MSNDPSDVRGEVARRLAELRRREVLAADREAALLETPRPDPRIDAVLAEFRSQVRPSSAEGLFVGERTTQTVVGVDKTDWRGKRKVTTVITGTKNTELAKGWVILRGKGLTRFFGIVLVVTVDGALKLGVRSQDFLPKSPVFGVVYIEPQHHQTSICLEVVIHGCTQLCKRYESESAHPDSLFDP